MKVLAVTGGGSRIKKPPPGGKAAAVRGKERAIRRPRTIVIV